MNLCMYKVCVQTEEVWQIHACNWKLTALHDYQPCAEALGTYCVHVVCVVILYVCVDVVCECVCLCLSFRRGLDLLQDGDTCPTTAGQEDTEQEPATVDELYDLEHYDSSGEEEGESLQVVCMIPIPVELGPLPPPPPPSSHRCEDVWCRYGQQSCWAHLLCLQWRGPVHYPERSGKEYLSPFLLCTSDNCSISSSPTLSLFT